MEKSDLPPPLGAMERKGSFRGAPEREKKEDGVANPHKCFQVRSNTPLPHPHYSLESPPTRAPTILW